MIFEIHGLSPEKSEAMKARIKEEIKKILGDKDQENESIFIEIYPTTVEDLSGREKPYVRFFSGTLARNESEILRTVNRLIDLRHGAHEVYHPREA